MNLVLTLISAGWIVFWSTVVLITVWAIIIIVTVIRERDGDA